MIKSFKILVTGGRDFDDFELLDLALSSLKDILGTNVTLAHGAAKGLDYMAGNWAYDNGWQALPYPAKWELYKKAAGGIRNQQMLCEFNPDLVLSFPGGSGTFDMTKRAAKIGKVIWYVNRL
jgi:hypothetical protein